MFEKKTARFYVFSFVLTVFCIFFSAGFVRAQTCDVTWRKADNPRTISGTVTIPAGQTVCVEPGVNIQFTDTAQINLFGRIVGTGSAAEHITFITPANSPNRIEVVGTLDLQFADLSLVTNLNAGGSFYCRNCNFGRLGLIATFDGLTSHIDTDTRFLSLDNAVFDSNEQIQGNNACIFGGNFTATLRNITFRNSAFLFINTSYLYIDNLTSQNSPTDGLVFTQNTYQPTFFNNLNITNSAGAGLRLDAGNFEIGPNVVIQNTEYPVKGRGGLMPNSQIPASGNRNNWIEVGQPGGRDTIYAPQSVPYVVDLFTNMGGIEIFPGTTFKARQNFAFYTQSGALRVLGLPSAPITIEPFIAGQKWTSGQFNSSGDRLEYVVLDGSQFGIVNAGGNGLTYWIDNSVLKNHDTALTSPNGNFAFLAGNLFSNNNLAIAADSGIRASGKTNPNLFENNQTAMTVVFGSNADARYNWWNSPTGPTAPNNPGGTGEIINGFAQIFPFRTARPDTTDHPPVVRMPRVPHRFALGYYQGLLDAGSKQILTWQAADDRQIVKQKILFSDSSNSRDDFTLIADNLPAAQRNFELTVPGTGFQVTGSPTFVRVVAVDDKGQEGFDEWQVIVPSGEDNGNLQITSNVAGQTFRGGQEVPLTWTVTAPFLNSQFNAFLILDADRRIISLGGGNSNGAFLTPKIPLVSTDSARFAVAAYGTANRQKWFFSEPFAIRPDSRYIDAAPQITLQTPAAGQQFPAGGGVVPISWTATDDEAIRQFNIQASTDGGRTWIEIAVNLPPTATNYNWQLPPNGSAVNDVRVRVITVDRRFQNTSAGQTRVFNIAAPANAAPGVQLTSPANNSSIVIGRSAFFTANATDSDGAIQRVEFYETNSGSGVSATTLLGSDTTAPYQIAWDTRFTGNHTITARAYDNHDAVVNSAPINFNVVIGGGQAPLPINPPELDLPNDGQNFPANSNITLRAAPGTGSRPIVRMDFYNGTTLIGSDTTAPYEIVWNNIPQGRYAIFARTIANNGAEATSKQADISVGNVQTTRRPQFDFDGDGKADISVFRPSSGTWYLNQSTSGFSALQFGIATDKIVPADFDADGKTDIAVYRGGNWYILQSSNNQFRAAQFGLSSDLPQTGDFDGDGKADLAVFRPSDGVWYLLQSQNGFSAVQFGQLSDKPVSADYDGDGKFDVAVYRGGTWYVLQSRDGFKAVQFGVSTDTPTIGDYDGDAKADFAVFRSGTWYVLRSRDGFYAAQFGISSDIPVAADYDGDGKTDVAVYRDGIWYLLRSQQGFGAVQFGTTNDRPIPAAFVP